MKEMFYLKRRYFRICAVLLVLCSIFTSSALATEVRASEQIRSYEMNVVQNGGGQLEIYFMIDGKNIMKRIGARSIAVYEPSGTVWSKVVSYNQDDAGMSVSNDFHHSNSILFNGTIGVQYQVVITVFAQDSSGSDSRTQTFYVRAT